jgi:hypothetical protein
MKKTILIIICASIAVMYGCDNEKPKPGGDQPQELCDSLAITYEGHIKAIVDASCNSAYCHAASAGGFMLGTYTEVKATAEMPKFLGAIKHENGFKQMPSGQPKLSDDIIQQLECWVQNGFVEK